MSLESARSALTGALTSVRDPIVIGIGNEVSGDDGLGPLVLSLLRDSTSSIKLLDVGPVPENFVSKIASMKPSHIIIVDAAVIPGEPGTIGLVESTEVDDRIFMTHHIPLGRTLARLCDMWPCEVIIIGVRPETVEFGAPMTPAVREAAECLAELLKDLDKALSEGRGIA